MAAAPAPTPPKALEADEEQFIQQYLEQTNQDCYWKGHVDLYTHGNPDGRKTRLLLITNLRLLYIKRGVFGFSVRQNNPFMEMTELKEVDGAGSEHLVVAWTEDRTLDILTPQIVPLTHAIMFAYRTLTFGWSRDLIAMVRLSDGFYNDLYLPQPDPQDSLLAQYIGQCDRMQIEPDLSLIDHIMYCFETSVHELDLSVALEHTDRTKLPETLTALARAMQFTGWFSEVVAVDFNLRGAEGISALAPIWETLTVKRTVLVNVKASGKNDFKGLARALEGGRFGLKYLNLARNALDNSGLKSLVNGFLSSGKALHTLCLRKCGFSAKGFQALAELMSTSVWSTQLTILDVSENTTDKKGSQALGDIMRKAKALEQLYAGHCDLHVESVLEALASNHPLYSKTLTTIGLSGNKVGKKAMPLLCAILNTSTSVTHVYLANGSLARKQAIQLFEAVCSNTTLADDDGSAAGKAQANRRIRYWIDASDNDLAPKGAREIAEVFAKADDLDTLHTLVMNRNNFGVEGVSVLAKALTGSKIRSLSIDGNLKSGIFSGNIADATAAVAEFMLGTPTLRELSMEGGDSQYLKSDAFPVIDALKSCEWLRYIGLGHNRLGDEGLLRFCEALKHNKSLQSFDIERNRIGLDGLRALLATTRDHNTLVDFAVPMVDMHAAVKGASVPVVQELQDMALEFHNVLERNRAQRRASQQAKAAAREQAVSVSTPPQSLSAIQTPYDAESFGRRSSLRPMTERRKRSLAHALDNLLAKGSPHAADTQSEVSDASAESHS